MNKNAKKFMQRAIELSKESISNHGGPFGAVVVRDDKIVGEGFNQVTNENDPTAHGEMVAIRNACKNLETYDLSDCEIYTSCEPCPMCLSAIMWARIPVIYYANTRKDAADIGFDDDFFYQQVSLPMKKREIKSFRVLEKQAKEIFDLWESSEDKQSY